MARPIRFQHPGEIYHAMARGDGGGAAFETDDGRKSFEFRLGQVCGSRGWRMFSEKNWQKHSENHEKTHRRGSARTAPIHDKSIKIMKTKIKTRILVLGFILIPSILAAEEPADWTESLEAKVTEVLKIKEEAMKFPTMRSENGVLGKRCEILMDEIGEMIKDPKWIQKLKDREEKNIKAKIALWAADRKKRKRGPKRRSWTFATAVS